MVTEKNNGAENKIALISTTQMRFREFSEHNIIGSSGGSLVMAPDCKLQSWVQIQQSPQPTVDCQSLDGLPSGMALWCRLSSEGRQRSIYKKHQKQLRKKKKYNIIIASRILFRLSHLIPRSNIFSSYSFSNCPFSQSEVYILSGTL